MGALPTSLSSGSRVAAAGAAAPPFPIHLIVPTRDSHRLLPRLVASLQAQTGGDWRVTCIDGGSGEEHRAWLEALCLGDGRFRWLGQVDRPGKLRLLESIDVFAMPTVHPEAKGIPVIESMAAGVPVAAPAHGTFPELLDDERAGLLHAPGDPEALAATLCRLLDDEPLAARLGRHGHGLAITRHTADRMAEEHERLYERLRSRS